MGRFSRRTALAGVSSQALWRWIEWRARDLTVILGETKIQAEVKRWSHGQSVELLGGD